jgi:hypothetical protein
MVKDAYYRRLARANRRIADARERIDEQKARVLELAGRPECGDATSVLRRLDHSLRLMTHQRALLVRQLMNWPDPDERKAPQTGERAGAQSPFGCCRTGGKRYG